MATEIMLVLPDAEIFPEVHGRQTGQVATAQSKRTHIVAILPRGEAIRNFVYTNALDEAALESKITLLSVRPNQELEDLLRSRYQNVFQLREFQEKWIVRIQRELLEMAHGRWLWSEAARDRWRLRDIEADSPAKWLKRSAKKLSCYPFANRPGLELLSRVERVSSRMFRTTDEYLRFFEEQRPSLVFNGSHVHSQVAIQAVQAAQWLGIPTATFIFSWDNLTSQGRINPPYDYYLVWNEAIRGQLLDIYKKIRSEQVFVTGTPQFDFHFQQKFFWTREEFCRRVNADPARPIVLYTTGMANHMPGEPRIVEGIADMLRQMDDAGSPQLLVRIYPKDRTNRFQELQDRRPDILFPPVPWEPTWLTPCFDDTYLLTNTLRHSAVGINIASTISLELCMFDKPVINVAYNPPGVDIRPIDYERYYQFDHYRPVVQSRAVMLARSEQEMSVMLRNALDDPMHDTERRQALINSMFQDTLDGSAGIRLAERLVEFAGGGDALPRRNDH
ncbi:MAG: hypothetical protein ND895_26595 [Pyrinomonadaceae bacterium]|nr:hypothetical protein [Pyrinomonadaceae bacterium]